MKQARKHACFVCQKTWQPKQAKGAARSIVNQKVCPQCGGYLETVAENFRFAVQNDDQSPYENVPMRF